MVFSFLKRKRKIKVLKETVQDDFNDDNDMMFVICNEIKHESYSKTFQIVITAKDQDQFERRAASIIHHLHKIKGSRISKIVTENETFYLQVVRFYITENIFYKVDVYWKWEFFFKVNREDSVKYFESQKADMKMLLDIKNNSLITVYTDKEETDFNVCIDDMNVILVNNLKHKLFNFFDSVEETFQFTDVFYIVV